jgi:transformation/transcription domain-associated protein
LFIPQLIHSLGKLIMSLPSSVESRVLLLDIVETIWSWEKRARSEPTNVIETSQDAMEIDTDPSFSSSSWLLGAAQQELVVSYLVRLVVAQSDASRSGLVNRSLGYLTEMLELQYWSEVEVKLAYFIRAFDQVCNLKP